MYIDSPFLDLDKTVISLLKKPPFQTPLLQKRKTKLSVIWRNQMKLKKAQQLTFDSYHSMLAE